MLDYLLSVWNRVTSFFSSLWENAVWYYQTAKERLLYYYNYLHDSTTDYKWWRMPHLIDYQYRVKPPTEEITVFNYGKTKFTAIESFADTMEYRFTLVGGVRQLVRNLFPNLFNLSVVMFPKLIYYFNIGQTILDFIFGPGQIVLANYVNYDKPTVDRLSAVRDGLAEVGKPVRVSKLLHLQDTLWGSLIDIVQVNAPSLGYFFANLVKFKETVSDVMLPKVRLLVSTHFAPITFLTGAIDKVQALVSEQFFSRSSFLFGERWLKTYALVENTDNTVLSLLAAKFFDWFLDRLFEWLNQPAS